MNFRGSEKIPEVTENNLEDEAALDFLVQVALLKSTTINQGNNGIIKKVRTEDLPPELADYLAEKCGMEKESQSFTFKMIKIYEEGIGKREFDIQNNAYEILEKNVPAEDADNYAKIPKPYLFRELTVDNDDLKQLIGVDGLDADRKKIEIILMDYIEGEDLAAKIYKTVIENHPMSAHLKEDLATMRIDELQDEVGRILDFKLPGAKSSNPSERAQEAERVFNQNVEKIVTFFSRKNIKLDAKIFEKVGRTLELLHRHGIYHRDLHERNIMVSPNDDVYLIDYGEAIKTDSKDKEDVYSADGKRLVQDDTLSFRYEKVLNNDKSQARKTNGEVVKEYEKISNTITDDNLDKISSEITTKINGADSSKDKYWEDKCAIVELYLKAQTADSRKKIIDKIVRQNNRPFFTKLLLRLL